MQLRVRQPQPQGQAIGGAAKRGKVIVVKRRVQVRGKQRQRHAGAVQPAATEVHIGLAAERPDAGGAQLLYQVLQPHLGGLGRLRAHGRWAVRAWDSASSAPKQRW